MTSEFLNILTSFGILPTITKPTRITCDSATLIDNIFINCYNCAYVSRIICADMSDHCPTYISVDLQCSDKFAQAEKYKRSFNKENFNSFKEKLKSIMWNDFVYGSPAVDNCNPDLLFNSFYNKFKMLFEESFPVKTISNKTLKGKANLKPWLSESILLSCKVKAWLLKLFIKHPTRVNRTKYRLYANTLKSIIRAAERNYYLSEFRLKISNSRETWKLLNFIINKGNRLPQPLTMNINNKMTNSFAEISAAFNKFFVNIGPTLAKQIPLVSDDYTTFLNDPVTNSMILLPTSSSEIQDIISNLKQDLAQALMIFHHLLSSVLQVSLLLIYLI